MKKTRIALPLTAALLTLSCSESPEPESTAEATPEPPPAVTRTVTILSPTAVDGASGPSVTVQLAVDGFEIRPAGDTTAGSGHHHLYLDADLTPAGEPVPTVPGSIIHMGDASTEYTFEGVAPGEHRLIAVVGDAFHVPLQPWVVDTVVFTVR